MNNPGYRDGQVYCQEALKAFDHDFPSLAQGVIIPHGIYDLVLNHGWLHLGLSRDTTEFACDSLRLFWQCDGLSLYPNASAILLLCDGGGSNSCRKHLFKEDLQALVNELRIPIRVAHYPAYCSKFNPIERRLFCHVTRACQGVLFDSLQTVERLMQKTTTQSGLSVTVRVIDKLYETGRKVSEHFKKKMPIVFEPSYPNGTTGPCHSEFKSRSYFATVPKSLISRSGTVHDDGTRHKITSTISMG